MRHTIFFDLDGTLTDPREGITRCIHHSLQALAIEVPAGDDLTWCIGPPLLDSFRTLVGEALAPRALAYYRERFAEVGWRENRPYPDIAHLLRDLREQGAELHVATSKPQVFANRILSHFGLADCFTRVFGAELDGTRSHKPDLLRYALAETRAANNATRPAMTRPAIMIGDRCHDVAGAKCNDMASIGVTWGYGSRQELEEAAADFIVDSPAELLELLAMRR